MRRFAPVADLGGTKIAVARVEDTGRITHRRLAPTTPEGGVAVVEAIMALLDQLPAKGAGALSYGLGGGVLNTATNVLVSHTSASGRGVALNLLGFSFSLGAVTARSLVSLAAKTSSLPTVLHILAIAPAIVLVVILALRFSALAHSGALVCRTLLF